MLTTEVAEFYGVKDPTLCADFVTFINGMLALAESNRRECWSQLCIGLINVHTKMKALQAACSDLETKHETLLQKFNEMNDRLKKSVAVTDKLNVLNKEYKAQIEALNAQISSAPKPPHVDQSKPMLQIEAAKAQTQSTGSKPEAQRAKRSFPSPPAVPDSDDEQPPPAKKDKTEIIVELRKKISCLISENERLDTLFSVLKKTEAPPVETVKQRMTQEDANRLRKTNMDLEAKLAAVTEEARHQARKYTELIKDNDAAWEKERLEWTKQLEGLSHRAPSVSQPSILLPSAFSLPCGSVMVCPVPTRTGKLVSLLEIYQSWLRFPADNEGTFFTSFLCPYTTQLTSLASADQVILIHSIAAELRLFVIPPLRFQYFINGNWMDFSFIDQISIAAMCCKHYRLGTTRGVETVMVCHGDFIFKLHISDNVVDFQMQPVHNMAKISSACLLEGVPGFFQRWTFPTGSDGNNSSPAADQ